MFLKMLTRRCGWSCPSCKRMNDPQDGAVAAQQSNTKTVVKRADDTKEAQGLADLLLATAKPSGLS